MGQLKGYCSRKAWEQVLVAENIFAGRGVKPEWQLGRIYPCRLVKDTVLSVQE